MHQELPQSKSGDEITTSPERREELPRSTFYRKHNVISEHIDAGGSIRDEVIGPPGGYFKVDCIHDLEFIDGQWREKSSRRVTHERVRGKDWRENERDVSERYACSDPENKDKTPIPLMIEDVAVVGRDIIANKVLREMSREELNALISAWKRDGKPSFVIWNNIGLTMWDGEYPGRIDDLSRRPTIHYFGFKDYGKFTNIGMHSESIRRPKPKEYKFVEQNGLIVAKGILESGDEVFVRIDHIDPYPARDGLHRIYLDGEKDSLNLTEDEEKKLGNLARKGYFAKSEDFETELERIQNKEEDKEK